MEPWAQEGLSLWPPTARKPPPFSQGQGTPFSAFHPPSSPNRAALISSILLPRTVHPGPLVGLGMAGVGQWMQSCVCTGGKGRGVSVGNGRGLANQSIDGTAYAVKTCCKITDEKVPSAHSPPRVPGGSE